MLLNRKALPLRNRAASALRLAVHKRAVHKRAVHKRAALALRPAPRNRAALALRLAVHKLAVHKLALPPAMVPLRLHPPIRMVLPLVHKWAGPPRTHRLPA